jgi:alkylated DNA repair dioxygenase AlkB
VNEYLPGQGIGAHTDNIHLFDDTVQCLSLSSHTTMIFRFGKHSIPVVLKPRSLVVMKGVARYKWTHEIPAVKTDEAGPRRVRYSITVRETI